MRIFGATLIATAAALLFWGLHYEQFLVESAGSVDILAGGEWKIDKIVVILMAGFVFVAGTVALGTGAIVSAIKASKPA